jgi:hypothetical protein
MEPLRDLWVYHSPTGQRFIDNHTNRDSLNKFVFFLKNLKNNLFKTGNFIQYNLVDPVFTGKYHLGDLFPLSGL